MCVRVQGAVVCGGRWGRVVVGEEGGPSVRGLTVGLILLALGFMARLAAR